jgi:hypothetical protein
MKVIKASELGVYLYCHRAWSFQRQGMESQNQAALEAGTAFHKQHGLSVRQAGLLKALGIILLIMAAVILVAWIAQQVNG